MFSDPEENDHVRLIDVLTINEHPESEQELIEVVENACHYFPRETWDGIEYLGAINMEHDVKIASNRKVYGAFIFEKLVRRIRQLRDTFKAFELMLGITSDPIVTVHYRFEMGTYERMVNLVHDFVSEDVGVISLFRIKDESTSRLIAHGLGHNRGLRHHMSPIDLMYIDLLNYPMLDKEAFCKECISKLEKKD